MLYLDSHWFPFQNLFQPSSCRSSATSRTFSIQPAIPFQNLFRLVKNGPVCICHGDSLEGDVGQNLVSFVMEHWPGIDAKDASQNQWIPNSAWAQDGQEDRWPACYQVRGKEANSGSFQPVSHFTSLSHHISPGYIFIAPHPGSSEWRCVAGLSRFTEEAVEQAALLTHPAREDRHGHSLTTEALLWLEKEEFLEAQSSRLPGGGGSRISTQEGHQTSVLLRWLMLSLQSLSHRNETMTDTRFKAWGLGFHWEGPPDAFPMKQLFHLRPVPDCL